MREIDEDRIDVAVTPRAALAARPRLLAALEEAFPVRFGNAEELPPGTPLIAFGPDADPSRMDPPPRATFSVHAADLSAAAEPQPVTLADAPEVERSVRGITLHDRIGAPLALGDGERVLASTASSSATPFAAVWVARGDAHRVAAVLPELEEDQVLYALLSQRAIASVALVHFLRGVCGDRIVRRRPRAAFVFDDPNLRWRSYGYIDYEGLVAHADEHGYHVAMAMIPLDAAGGRVHRPTAELFTRRRDRLSLVVHGNDHVHNELLLMEDERVALATAAQALRRIERFEARSGVEVDRVMMPPHGRCSRAMSRALAAVGFDALSAIHPLPWTAAPPASPPLAAWHAADFVGGCAVIPRTPLISTEADLALRAFLDHPMIVYGHHEDVADGLEPLAEAARKVNRAGDVEWTSVGAIAHANYETRAADDGTLVVRPFSNRVTLPADASTVTVQAPTEADAEGVLAGFSIDDGPVHRFGEPVSLNGGARSLRLHTRTAVDRTTIAAPAWSPWPKLRRAGTEVRDRVLPLRP
jgi:hypothetical protein